MKRLIIFLLLSLSVIFQVSAQFYRFRANKEYKALLKTHDLQQHYDFLQKYPDYKRITEVSSRIKTLEFQKDYDNALKADSLQAYREVCNTYSEETDKIIDSMLNIPSSEMINFLQRKIREYSLWDSLMKDKQPYDTSITEFISFLKQFPDSKYSDSAKEIINYRLDTKFWDSVKYSYDTAKYLFYIQTSPKGLYKDEAWERYKLCKEWDSVKKVNTHEAYFAFYNHHMFSHFSDSALLAMKQIEQKAWDRANRINTYSAYEHFLDLYPLGYYSSHAEAKILEIAMSSNIITSLFTDKLRNRKTSKITVTNYGNIPIYVVFSGTQYKKIYLPSNSAKTITLRNGDYRFKETSANPAFILTKISGSDKITLVGYDASIDIYIFNSPRNSFSDLFNLGL